MDQTGEAEPPAPVAPGDVLAEKYRVEKVLGSGGMGVVVSALHMELDQLVAVKFLHPEALQSPEASARFLREARAAVKIKSENVARVIDVGRLENGAPYMVMEYLQGQDLSHVVAERRIEVSEAVDYLIQGCAAMVEAHAAGIVHRDLKPANLFLTRGSDGAPVIKVLDFGISKLSVPDVSDANLTKTSVMMGSPYYMSPEQMKSARSVDHRADIWALGVILFELLAGAPPFAGETLPELIANIMTDAPLNLRQSRPDVPPELEAVISKCLQKDRDQRYSTVADLANALAPFASRATAFTLERISKIAGGRDTSALPPPPMANAPAMAGTATNWSETQRNAGETQTTVEKGSSKLAVVAGALGLVLIVGGAGAWLAFSSRPEIEPDRALTTPVAEDDEANAAAAKATKHTANEKAGSEKDNIVPVVPVEEPARDEQALEPSAQTANKPAAGSTFIPRASNKTTTKIAKAPSPAKQAAAKQVKTQPAKQELQTAPGATSAAKTKKPVQKKNPLAIELK